MSRLATYPSSSSPARKLPQQARSRALVDALLVAAERSLLARGLTDTTMNHIARLAGASIGSVYQYFPNKQELVAALLQRRAEQVTQEVLAVAVATHDKPLKDGVRALIHAVLEGFCRDRKLYEILWDQLDQVERPRSQRSALDPIIVAAAAYLMRYRSVIRGDPERTAYLLVVGGAAVIQDAVRSGDDSRFEWLEAELCTAAEGYLGLI